MNTLENMLDLYESMPEDATKVKLEQLVRIKDVYALVVRNLQNRNNELIVSDTIQTQMIQLIMEQRFMLFNVLGEVKKAMDIEGRPDDPLVHMIFEVVDKIKEMDHEWQEKVGDTNIKS